MLLPSSILYSKISFIIRNRLNVETYVKPIIVTQNNYFLQYDNPNLQFLSEILYFPFN